jgi:hypothetical protein
MCGVSQVAPEGVDAEETAMQLLQPLLAQVSTLYAQFVYADMLYISTTAAVVRACVKMLDVDQLAL